MKLSCRTTGVLLAAAVLVLLAPRAWAQEKSVTQSGFVSTPDGIKIHYIEARPGHSVPTWVQKNDGGMERVNTSVLNKAAGPAVLFVPGWTMSAEIWEKQLAYFGKTHRVVAMDPRSQGESTKANDGHYPAARARDIKAVIDELRLAPVVLVGWSMAVTEAAAYVDQFGTAALAGLVLVDGVAGLEMPPEMSKGFLAFLTGLQTDRRKMTEAFVRSMYRKPQSEEYLRRIIESALRTPTNSAVALGLSGFWTDNRAALAKINKPTLIIGTKSAFSSSYEDMHTRIAGSRIEILDGVGHALFVDDPEHFNSLLDDFLKNLH